MKKTTMKAARFYGNRDIRIAEVSIPTPEENEVLLEIEWCGICGSDLHEFTNGPSTCRKPGNPHPLTHETLPSTLGHEFCGRIIQVPQISNSDLKIGQAVMVDPRLYCGSCSRCENTATHGCKKWGFRGYNGKGGGLSEFVAVDTSMVHPIPEEMLDIAAWIEPLAVALHAVKLTDLPSSEFSRKGFLVLGGGPIGIAVMLILRMKGAGKIFVSEPSSKRRVMNAELADLVLDPRGEKIGDRCRVETGGEGVEFVFDCAGVGKALEDGMNALRWKGMYINVASWVTPFTVPLQYFMAKELVAKCSFYYNDVDFKETVDAFSGGAFPGIEKLITSRVLLEDVVEKGFEELLSNTDEHIKIMVSPKKTLSQA